MPADIPLVTGDDAGVTAIPTPWKVYGRFELKTHASGPNARSRGCCEAPSVSRMAKARRDEALARPSVRQADIFSM